MKLLLLATVNLALLTDDARAVLFPFQLDKAGYHQISFELDPYYSCVDYTLSLTDKPIPKTILTNEWMYYSHMLKNLYLPRYILVEGSIYPLPVAGVYIKENYDNFYQNAELSHSLNIVRAVTEGFPEPWAASFFLGNVADFTSSDGKEVVGKGYSGWLFSYGGYHIVDNIMVRDNWWESEIKLKGSDLREAHNLSWSYSLGVKFHDNSEISDVCYVSVKRNRIDFVKHDINPLLGFFVYDSEQEFRADFKVDEVHRARLSRVSFLFGKNFPVGKGNVTFSFATGVVKLFQNSYSGELKRRIEREWTLIFRPNVHIKFN